VDLAGPPGDLPLQSKLAFPLPMVAGLFLLALASFAVMGLFVAGLTIYSNLRGRAERADLARDALGALFSSRQALVTELEELARETASVSGGEPGRLAEALERRLHDTDRAITDALRAYNSAAAEFNHARSLVPAAFVARVPGLGERELLVLPQ
jgi:hypothetical protein